MPQCLILNLVTQTTVAPKHLQGYSLQQLFFHLVDIVDPELGHVLRRDKKNRSYSLSALQITPEATKPHSEAWSAPINVCQFKSQRKEPSESHQSSSLQYGHSHNIPAKTECWWRITFLDDALFDHLIFLWNQLGNEVYPLGSASVKLVDITTGRPGLDLGASCSYLDLYEQASAHIRDIHLQFMTPTAFEMGDSITPLPTAAAIFHPLRKYWNCYSSLVFAPSLINHIEPLQFDIKTSPVQVSLRNSFRTVTGCTGTISFRVGDHDDPFITKRINTLADFSKYCGIGVNTRFGMGCIKRVQPAKTLAVPTQSHARSNGRERRREVQSTV